MKKEETVTISKQEYEHLLSCKQQLIDMIELDSQRRLYEAFARGIEAITPPIPQMPLF